MFSVSREYVLKMARPEEWPSWRRGRVVRLFPEHVEQIKSLGSQRTAIALTRKPPRRIPPAEHRIPTPTPLRRCRHVRRGRLRHALSTPHSSL